MLFPTLKFAIFFIIIFAISIFTKKYRRFYPLVLIIASLIFYGSFDIRFPIFLTISVIINFVLQYKLTKDPTDKRIFASIIIFNILTLALFKYFNFFLDSITNIGGENGLVNVLSSLQIIFPVGISFIIFRIISQAFDIFRRKIEKINFLDFFLFVSFFPQITAGPLQRAGEFYKDLENVSKFEYKRINVALLIAVGLIKKLVLGSILFNYIIDPFSIPGSYSSLDLIAASLAYFAYIYVDFSGYTDLSNAVSNLLGFRTVQNFDGPYAALDLQTFWRKWHMSFSFWLRDYLYIPLGGNRHGTFRKYLNLFLTMLIGGIWHGATLPFVIWGILHGSALALNHILLDLGKALKIKLSGLLGFVIKTISFVITFIFINITWIFFNSKDINIATEFIGGIFNSQVTDIRIFSTKLIIIVIGVVIYNFIGEKLLLILEKVLGNMSKFTLIVTVVVIFYIIINLAPVEIPPFLYFNF